jgi:hypothetical protein
MRVNQLENDFEIFQYDDDYSEDAKAANIKGKKDEEILDPADVQVSVKKNKKRKYNDGLSSDDENEEDAAKNANKSLIVAAGEKIGMLGNIEGAVIGIENIIGVECTANMKQLEGKIRAEKI